MLSLTKLSSQKGFSTVEILLSVAIVAVLATSLIGGMIYSQSSALFANDRYVASLLADEGIEAVRNMSDGGFTDLANGTYGLTQVGNTWSLSGTSDTTDNFVRQVTIGDVINSADVVNPNSKQVTATVTWNQDIGGTKSVSTSTQVNYWKKTTTKTWQEGYVKYGEDLTSCTSGAKVASVNNFAYIVCPSTGTNFVVLNISNTAEPTIAGTLALSGTPTNIYVLGTTAYVSSRDDAQELQIVNVATPTAPALRGSYNAAGTEDALGVYALGTVAYLTRVDAGTNPDYLEINVNNPGSPSLTASINIGATVYEPVILTGPERYIVTADDAREVIQITASGNNRAVGVTLNLPGTVDATTITGINANDLFVVQGNVLYALGRPGTTFPIRSSLTLSGTIQDVATNTGETYAYVGVSGGNNEFQVIDTTTKTAIAIAKTVDVPNSTAINGVFWNSTLDKVALVSDAAGREFALASPN